MAYRGMGLKTLTGTPQPAFGTTITAYVQPTGDRYLGPRGISQPRDNPSIASLSVTDITFFRVGDRIQLGTNTPGAFQDGANITAIVPLTGVTGTITVQGLTAIHQAGEFLVLAIPVATYQIRPVTVGTVMYFGEDSTVGAASKTLIDQITTSQAGAGLTFSPSNSPEGNCFDTPHLWITGTAADTYLPSLLLI